MERAENDSDSRGKERMKEVTELVSHGSMDPIELPVYS